VIKSALCRIPQSLSEYVIIYYVIIVVQYTVHIMVDIAVGNVLAGLCCYSRDLARAHHCSHELAEFHCIYALADGFQYDHALAQYNHCGHARQAVDMTYVNASCDASCHASCDAACDADTVFCVQTVVRTPVNVSCDASCHASCHATCDASCDASGDADVVFCVQAVIRTHVDASCDAACDADMVLCV